MISPHPLKILLIEDDELFRLGLRVRLQQEPEIAAIVEAEDGETALELTKQQVFDLVLLDIGLPGIGGIETCIQLKQQQPHLPILALTSRSEPVLVTRLVQVGIQGYCLKGIAADTLMLAIRSIVAGASWWDATATTTIQAHYQTSHVAKTPTQLPLSDRSHNQLANNQLNTNQLSDRSSASEPHTHHLTPREQEILTLIAAGKTNQEIAEILYIVPGTVRVHVHAILHKLGVADRQQAVQAALQMNLITANH